MPGAAKPEEDKKHRKKESEGDRVKLAPPSNID
jgi:hypothetical protein